MDSSEDQSQLQMLIPEGTTDEEDHSPPLKGWGDMPL